jgi:hypothetical protein
LVRTRLYGGIRVVLLRSEIKEKDMTSEMKDIQTVHQTMVKFLRYAFNDISYEYNNLTDAEKALCTEEEFAAMLETVLWEPRKTRK